MTDLINLKSVDTAENNESESVIMMESLLKYLEPPFEKKYVSTYFFRMGSSINDVQYYNHLKIRKHNGDKCDIGTVVKFSIGMEHFYEKIDENTEFDSENYFKYNINLPGNIFFVWHEIKLSILTNDGLGSMGFFDIVVNGSNFNVEFPKNVIDSDILFFYNNREYIATKGMFKLNMDDNDPNKKNIEKENDDIEIKMENPKSMTCEERLEMSIINAINYNENKNKVYLTDIKSHDNKYLTKCVYIDNDTNELYPLNLKWDSHKQILKYLKESTALKKYFIEKGYIDTLTDYYCFGLNTHRDIMQFEVCEDNGETYIMKYNISRPADGIRHIDIFNNFSSSYSFTASIKSNDLIMYDFGKLTTNTNYIRLEQNEYLNLYNKKSVLLHLVIEIPKEKLDEWTTLETSYGYIYANESLKKILEDEPPYANIKFNTIS